MSYILLIYLIVTVSCILGGFEMIEFDIFSPDGFGVIGIAIIWPLLITLLILSTVGNIAAKKIKSFKGIQLIQKENS